MREIIVYVLLVLLVIATTVNFFMIMKVKQQINFASRLTTAESNILALDRALTQVLRQAGIVQQPAQSPPQQNPAQRR